MIPVDPLQGPAVVLGMAGAVLVASRSPGIRRTGFGCWIVGNLLWLLHGIRTADPYVSVLFGFYGVTAIWGLKNCVASGTPCDRTQPASS